MKRIVCVYFALSAIFIIAINLYIDFWKTPQMAVYEPNKAVQEWVYEDEDENEKITEAIENKANEIECVLTAYCNCEECCGEWAGGATYIGVMPQENRTIAVDPDVIPLGSWVNINGEWYCAEDTGNFCGNHIDIYMDSHEECKQFGVQKATVYWEEN